MNNLDLVAAFEKAIAEERAKRKGRPVKVVESDTKAAIACVTALNKIKNDDYVMKNASRGLPK